MPHFSYENLNLVAGFLGTSKRPPLCSLGTGIGRADPISGSRLHSGALAIWAEKRLACLRKHGASLWLQRRPRGLLALTDRLLTAYAHPANPPNERERERGRKPIPASAFIQNAEARPATHKHTQYKICEGQSYSPTLQLFSPTRGLSHNVPRARALASTNTRSGPLTAHLVRGDCKLVAKMEQTSPSPGVHR